MSLIYFGAITIKDVSTGNIAGASDLPKTSFGPFSAYHTDIKRTKEILETLPSSLSDEIVNTRESNDSVD